MSKSPSFRLQIKHNGVRYDFGTVWPSDRFPGLHDVTFQSGDVAHDKYPKMDAAKAIQLANQRTAEGKKVAFVSLSAPKPPGGQSQNGGSRQSSDSGYQSGGFDDGGDLPF